MVTTWNHTLFTFTFDVPEPYWTALLIKLLMVSVKEY